MSIRKFFDFSMATTGALALAMGLVACGDDSSSGSDDSSLTPVESEIGLAGGKKVTCDEKKEGVVAALANGDFRRCEDGAWVKISREEALKADEILGYKGDASSSSVKAGSSSSGKVMSSSSAKTVSSSSAKAGSSSSDKVLSSSSMMIVSSSSAKVVGSSSSATPDVDPDPLPEIYECPDGSFVENEEDCPSAGSSSSDKPAWQYLNPGIEYGEFPDDRDGQVYKTVTIGEGDKAQTWMAENLNYNSNTEDVTNSWCGGGEGEKEGDCSLYGRLYTWAAAIDSVAIYEKDEEECGYNKSCVRFSASELVVTPVQGICPMGWHLPSNDEWSNLYAAVSEYSNAGKVLKANTDLWSDNTGIGSYGFSILPAGSVVQGKFIERGESSGFWSSTEYENNSYGEAWNQHFYGFYDGLYQTRESKKNGFSVRCIQNSPELGGGADLESSSSKYRCDADGELYENPEECPGHSDGITSSDSPGADSESSSPKYKCEADGKWYDDPEECPGHSDGITSSETPSSDSESSSPRKASWAYLDQNKTYDIFMDSRDGQVYKTITIGEGDMAQTWMAENLNYNVEGQSWCGGGEIGTKNEGDCDLYGRLYTWEAAVEACPEGWYLPGRSVWNALYTAVGGEAVAGKNLKANADLWLENTGSNSSGFSAIPAGRRSPASGNYDDRGKIANFWSSTLDGDYPWSQFFGYTYDDANRLKASVGFGFSVRCVKFSSFRGTDGKLVWQDLNPDKGYGEFIDSRDNQVYKTIKICNEKNENCQTWMAENLNYVPENVSDMWEGAWIGCYGQGLSIYTPDVVSSNCAMYGRLYSWDVAMDKAECGYGTSCGTELNPATPVRGICPEGWHLPSHHEFETLINNVGGLDTAGKSLKVVPFGTNSSGFSAVHAGVLYYGRFEEDLYFSSFWSSSEENEKSVYSLYMQGVLQGPHSSQAKFSGFLKNDATSVRCVKDTK